MPSTLLEAIQVTEEADGVRYRLPVSATGRGLALLILLLSVGLLGGMACFWASVLLETEGSLPVWAEIVLGSTCTLVLLAILWSPLRVVRGWMSMGWFWLVGHPELQLCSGLLSSGFYLGRLRKVNSVPVSGLSRLIIRPWATIKPQRSWGSWVDMTRFWDLAAETTDGELIVLLSGWPREWLVALADDVAGRCDLPTGFEPIDHTPIKRPPIVEGPVGDPFEESPRPPTGCRIVVEEHPDGVTVNVPADGVWRAARWLFIGGLLYATMLAIATPIVAYGYWKHPELWEKEGWGMTAFVIFHWVAATAMILEALGRGRLRACLAVVGDRLVFLQLGPCRHKREEWPRGVIADLRSNTAALGLEGRSYQSLQIRLTDGTIRQLLEGRNPAELLWVATLLRRALGMPVHSPDGDMPHPAALPPGIRPL